MRLLLAGLAFLSAGAEAQTSRDSFAQRALARALDDRCALFTESERLALDGAYLQVRGDLLRDGFSPRDIDSSYDRVIRTVGNRPCDDTDVQLLADDIRSAFAAWQRERFQDFMGAPSLWQASRPYAYDSWLISTAVSDAPLLRAGVYQLNGESALTVSAPADASIASLALVMRDPAQTPDLHDPTLGGLLTIEGLPAWTHFIPPADNARRHLPVSRQRQEEADMFRFADATLQALTALDPREAIRIEAFDAEGETVFVEFLGVGDFAAALAFVRSSRDLSAGR
ncbi:hypothetical protein [Hyphobacterium sp.]|uniref:hypothetical protein n=1 Tax=Hyphobacterium sp. TaxID=2004662 RepID=UPI003B517520